MFRAIALSIIVLCLAACGTANPYEGTMRHVVMFKFKDGTSPEKLREIENAFAALPSRIDSIIAYEWGTNVSPEGHDKGFTHCFIVTFADAEGRDEYLPHPAHKEFVAIIGPHLDDVHVLDFFSKSN